MRVVWTKAAVADLEAIHAYISRDSEYYAARFIGRILKAARPLSASPELGPVVPQFVDQTIRERIVKNYRVLYEVQTNQVVVLAVVHAARDIGSITLEP
jgi:plasmid stabilization system protein ParE